LRKVPGVGFLILDAGYRWFLVTGMWSWVLGHTGKRTGSFSLN